MGFHGSSAVWSATAVLSHNFVVDGIFGFTNQHTTVVPEGPVKCSGDELGILNSCPKPFSRDYATPQLTITGWASPGNSPTRDYLDPLVSALLGGWRLNGYFTAFSGQAFSVTSSSASLNAPGSPQRADQVKDTVAIPGDVGPNSAYFDVTAFRPVTAVRFGTAGFNSLRGPGVTNLDASIFRTIPIA
jgi:hypothetical protein